MAFLPRATMAAEDGYELWLRYRPVERHDRQSEYRAAFGRLVVAGRSPTSRVVREELCRGLAGLLGSAPLEVDSGEEGLRDGELLLCGARDAPEVATLGIEHVLDGLGEEGFYLFRGRVGEGRGTVIAANTDLGMLYGAFALLGYLQTERPLEELDVRSAPRIRYRLLSHWDNLDRTVERGYAGLSLWDWHKLPDYVSPRYADYARACASVGLNGSVLTNVNANALVLTERYLEKAAALADVFRPYGVRIFLTARFNAPVELGDLETADPKDARVAAWWRERAATIYGYVPDFGGFVVKANSEGQPGPHDYGRTHAEGANLLGAALAPYGGVVIWRAFVYDDGVPADRARQAYDELVPLDGKFDDNVCLLAKNGPIDFQPREPFHPLFGALAETSLFAEFQLTQEYLGFATHLAYLAPLIKETLDADTFAAGPGSTVARVIDGSVHGGKLTGIVAVANTGDERNWCGHPFAAANWFAFGRLAWDADRSSESIADEWLRRTFAKDETFVTRAQAMMLGSREAVVDYMTPLGLHHQMAWDHHYGPGPWVAEGRADWTSVYYHRADGEGVGFDRTSTGSDAVALYHPPVRDRFADRKSCPEEYLLWFHHVPWSHPMASGRTLWEELCLRYQRGVEYVRGMQRTWEELEGYVDSARFVHVRDLLQVQEKEARWWRDACVLYFQALSGLPLPKGYERPSHALEHFMRIRHDYVPGI